MLTSEDLKRIGHEVAEVIEDNVNPQFEEMKKDITEIRGDITEIRGDITEIRGDITEIRGDITEIRNLMVTKPYFDEKMADFEGATIARQRKQDQKINRLIEILKRRNVLEDADVSLLNEIHVFPVGT